MKIKKRHIVLSTLVLSLSAAVLLNWQLSAKTSVQEENDSRELGVATYVNSKLTSTSDEVAVSSVNIKNDPDLTTEQLEFFASSREERQRTQDEAVTLAQKVLELSESSEEAMEDAVSQLSKIEDNILAQSRIETTLKSKGFSDCVCCLDENSCTVIVPGNEVESNSALIIMDCVKEVTGLPFENINVVGV